MARVLLLSLIAWPVLAQDAAVEELADLPVEVSDAELIDTAVPLFLPPPEPDYSPLPESAEITEGSCPPVPFVGDACRPNYWIVSSRCAAQSHREACQCTGRLDVFHRTCDGRLFPTDLQTLSCQLVPGVPVCIFVHGSYVTWESQLADAEATYRRVRAARRCPLQMIFFTWPSDERVSPIITVDALIHGFRSEYNAFHLARLIACIPECCPVCLIGHSHGVRTALALLHLAGGGTLGGCGSPCPLGACRRYRLVMAAGAVNHDWLNPGERYCRALFPLECGLNFVNRKDIALTFYPLLGLRTTKALSKTGLTNRDAAMIGPQARKIHEMGIAHLIGFWHTWTVYYQQPAIIGAMAPYIYFQ